MVLIDAVSDIDRTGQGISVVNGGISTSTFGSNNYINAGNASTVFPILYLDYTTNDVVAMEASIIDGGSV